MDGIREGHTLPTGGVLVMDSSSTHRHFAGGRQGGSG